MKVCLRVKDKMWFKTIPLLVFFTIQTFIYLFIFKDIVLFASKIMCVRVYVCMCVCSLCLKSVSTFFFYFLQIATLSPLLFLFLWLFFHSLSPLKRSFCTWTTLLCCGESSNGPSDSCSTPRHSTVCVCVFIYVCNISASTRGCKWKKPERLLPNAMHGDQYYLLCYYFCESAGTCWDLSLRGGLLLENNQRLTESGLVSPPHCGSFFIHSTSWYVLFTHTTEICRPVQLLIFVYSYI